MKISIYLISGLFILGSCQLILGISNPKEENKSDLDAYLLEIGVDTTNSYVFYKPAFDSLSELPFKPDWPVGFRPIQFVAFNSSGSLVSKYASCEGSYKKLKLLESYPPENVWPIDSTENFESHLKMYRDFDGSKISVFSENGDLNIIVYWGKWMGRYGEELLQDLRSYKSENIKYKINVYKINVGEYYITEWKQLVSYILRFGIDKC